MNERFTEINQKISDCIWNGYADWGSFCTQQWDEIAKNQRADSGTNSEMKEVINFAYLFAF